MRNNSLTYPGDIYLSHVSIFIGIFPELYLILIVFY